MCCCVMNQTMHLALIKRLSVTRSRSLAHAEARGICVRHFYRHLSHPALERGRRKVGFGRLCLCLLACLLAINHLYTTTMNPRGLLRSATALSASTSASASSSTIARRSFHASAIAASHVGSRPIPLPPKVEITYPTASIDPETSIYTEAGQRFVQVKGPKGALTVPILPPVILNPPKAGEPLTVRVHDEEAKAHKSVWGLTRGLLNNAVKGVSEGYTVELRLVGVGYRAAVEPIPKVFRDIQASIPRTARPAKPGSAPYVIPPLPTDRLNIKLGFAHPVLIDIPDGITVTTPQPTKIVLQGIDNQKLGRFAAKIRRWRKPEPYRGKVCSLAQTLRKALTHRASSSATRRSSSRRSRRSRRPVSPVSGHGHSQHCQHCMYTCSSARERGARKRGEGETREKEQRSRTKALRLTALMMNTIEAVRS